MYLCSLDVVFMYMYGSVPMVILFFSWYTAALPNVGDGSPAFSLLLLGALVVIPHHCLTCLSELFVVILSF